MTEPFEAKELTSEQLAASYAELRSRCIELGRGLDHEQWSAMTLCCPEWSVKDVMAHMAGITTDILTGNLEGAATEAWADAHVENRRDKDMAAICDEWETNAPQIHDILSSMGDSIDPRFYLDAFTHEWDIRQATGIAAKPDLTLVAHTWTMLNEAIEERNGGPLPVEIDPFTLARAAMGRRSESQITELGLNPDGVVLWTANSQDIVDPVLSL